MLFRSEDIRKLWFFKEVLVDESKEVETPPSRVLRYLAVSTRNNDGNIRTRFIKLGQPAIEQPNTGNESETSTSKISLENYPVELTIKQAFNKFTVNPKGGIIVTGDEQGTVTSYLASPFWLRADSIFDANSEADSAILDLTFSEDGDTLLISNNNGKIGRAHV